MKFILAPLAGFTDAPFRRLCFECGADLAYTEMVSAAGLSHGSSPTRHLLETMPGEGPVACQLFGSREDDLAFAAREVSACRTDSGAPRFVELNLNAGCPMAKVTREGAGAKLAEDPGKVYRLLKAMVENSTLPVTLKTRLGPHAGRTTVFELLDAAQRAGARAFVLHARYTSQMHGGPVHLDTLAEVAAHAKIPVVGNGSVVDAKSAAIMAGTGVSAIMVGRAALSAPALFARLKGRVPPETNPYARHLEYILQFRERLVRRFPGDHIASADAFASVKMHVHLFRYFSGKPGAAALRARLNSVRTLDEMAAAVAGFAGA